MSEMVSETVADLTKMLGLPEDEQSAVAAWCGVTAPVFDGCWLPIWTPAEASDLVRIWHETGPECAE